MSTRYTILYTYEWGRCYKHRLFPTITNFDYPRHGELAYAGCLNVRHTPLFSVHSPGGFKALWHCTHQARLYLVPGTSFR